MLVLLQHFAMEKSHRFTEYDSNHIHIGNDNINGGKSISSFELIKDTIVFQCQTKHNPYSFAYCGLNIQLSPTPEQGIDLQTYDSLEFTLQYNASQHDTLLVYLSNLENTASKTIIRSNMHTLLPKHGIEKVHLKLNDFAVPSWWVLMQKNVDESSLTNFDNITKLRIVTGDNTQERTINFTVSDIILNGKWVNKDTLYLSLLIFWLLIISVDSVNNFKRIRQAYLLKEKESKALQGLNRALTGERDKFESLAKTDPLTHCYNREGIKGILQNQMDMVTERSEPCSIILLDIDHFKEVNDKFGHHEGDIVLVNIANLLHKNIKAKDSLARWGGEEFLVVCSNTSLESAIGLAESLRKLIASTNLSNKIQITSSFGVTQLDSNDFESSFKQADKALYKAKFSGRNNVQSG